MALIKIKLGKSHRKESDWTIIKDILDAADVLVIEPKDPSFDLMTIDHVLYDDGELVCFTNLTDCEKYMKGLGRRGKSLNYTIGVMPFIRAIQVADDNNLDLLIDPQDELGGVYMVYDPVQESLRAVRIAKRL